MNKKNSILLCLLFSCLYSYSQSTIDKFRQFINRSKQEVVNVPEKRVNAPKSNINDPQKMYNNGLVHYRNEEYTDAVTWFSNAAELGYKDAQVLLATCYIQGTGVNKSVTQAVFWFKKAAEQEDVRAQVLLGELYYEGNGVARDYKMATYWFKKAAEQGDGYSQGTLGRCYLEGKGVPKDITKAMYWFEKAANQGDVLAMRLLGDYYYEKKDYAKAFEWWKNAAEKGDANAQFYLGTCYYDGVGTSVDYSEAMRWFERASNQNVEEAKQAIEDMKKATVSLSVEGNATIYVDGSYKGNGKWQGILLPFGTHEVECRKDKHRSTNRTIEVTKEGSNTYVLSPPIPICGTLVVNTMPAGAEVLCDGNAVGYTPYKNENIIIGSHKIEVYKRYYKREQTEVDITEGQITEKAYSLESRIPVTITSSPVHVSLTMNGEKEQTDINKEIPEGSYELNIPRQYNGRGVLARKEKVLLDSLHLSHNISLKTDNNYDHATFFGIDYDMGLQAIGFNFGSNPGRHFMFEMNFFWGIKKSEAVYWINVTNPKLGNVSPYMTEYNHWTADIRMGPTFWCSSFLRVSPELGAQYLRLRESKEGNPQNNDELFSGGYVSALGSVRFRLSLSQHLGIHVTPEYRLNVSNKKVLPELSNDVDKWVNGFSVKAGLVFFFH